VIRINIYLQTENAFDTFLQIARYYTFSSDAAHVCSQLLWVVTWFYSDTVYMLDKQSC